MNILWTYIWLISYDPNYNWGGSSVHPPFLKDVFSQSVSPSTKIASSSDSASWVPWRMSISSSLPRSITTVWGSGSAAWTGDGLGFLFGRFFASGWVFLRFLRVPKNSGFGGSCRGSSIVSLVYLKTDPKYGGSDLRCHLKFSIIFSSCWSICPLKKEQSASKPLVFIPFGIVWTECGKCSIAARMAR